MARTTIVEQVLARASDKDRVNPGEIIDVKVDMAMTHDSGGPWRILEPLKELGMPIWDPSRVVLVARNRGAIRGVGHHRQRPDCHH